MTIGFDFGTSCSKIIVNAPYAGERSFALVVPDFFQMDGHPHLWKGILSLEKLSERLSLSPTSGSSQLSDLKTTLMGAPHRVMCKSKGAQLTSEHCCAAFIGLLLRLTKGWIWQNFSRFFGFFDDLAGGLDLVAFCFLAGVKSPGMTCGPPQSFLRIMVPTR